MQQIYSRTLMPKFEFNKVALLYNFIEITLRHGCSPVNFLPIFRTPFLKNISGGLFMQYVRSVQNQGFFLVLIFWHSDCKSLFTIYSITQDEAFCENSKKPLIIFAKCFTLDFSQGYEYVSGLNSEIYNI